MLKNEPCVLKSPKEETFYVHKCFRNFPLYFRAHCEFKCGGECNTAYRGESTDNMYDQLPVSINYFIESDIPEVFPFDG